MSLKNYMKKTLILFITSVLKRIGIGFERYGVLKSYKQTDADIDQILSKPSNELMTLLPYVKKSQSQLKQDLFVLSEFQIKKNLYKSDNINCLNYIYGVLPTIVLIMLIHAFFGVLNPGTAIRWRVNFELIFYFAPLLLYFNLLESKNENNITSSS